MEGALGWYVWDVNWGSHFQAVNGATQALVCAHALKHSTLIPMSEPGSARRTEEKNDPKLAEKTTGVILKSSPKLSPHHYRHQMLHVLCFTRRDKGQKSSLKYRLWAIKSSLWCRAFAWLTQCTISTLLCFLGLYGTALGIFCGLSSQIACEYLKLRRPSGYLQNNEEHNACMLIGSHSNCSDWYLCIGDRSVVDCMLNKPMLMLPENIRAWPVSKAFTLLHFLQLLAMTFAAANQGWDSIGMFILMTIAWLMHLLETSQAVQMWLEEEKISVETKSFQCSGRSLMIGAIQIYSQTTISTWIDSIMVPHTRRNAWLREICPTLTHLGDADSSCFSTHDKDWIQRHSEWSKAIAEDLKLHCGKISEV
ncbi:hypothetical protein GYMLUDRAFT_638453 [Collybiopsis luxurians FD-317 M1]|nr:hypothetical protein GYMLUDRAFT_638453 [Collybiopsis luxurians FD-317 M1]